MHGTLPAPPRYTATAIALHWLMALALVGSFALGLYMSDLPVSPLRLKLFNWHKWVGICILSLSALRLLWRLTHAPPSDLAAPAWQQRVARGVHGALYLLFFAAPLAGWAYSSAAGFPVVVFGVLPLPDFVPVDKALAEALKTLHKTVAFALALLVLLHVAAALKHHFVDRDGLLARMWPARGGGVRRQTFFALGLATVLAVLAAQSNAQQRLDAARSTIAFTSRQMGVPVEGRFKRFDAQIEFEPKQPETGRITISVDLLSVALGAAEIEAELGKPAWFDSAKFPRASFVSGTLRATGPGRLNVTGKLTLKGITRELVVPVTLTQSGALTTASGGFGIKRLDFGIGDGEWNDTSLVADEVRVRFQLVLSGVGPL